jgi:hypothetical protein
MIFYKYFSKMFILKNKTLDLFILTRLLEDCFICITMFAIYDFIKL